MISNTYFRTPFREKNVNIDMEKGSNERTLRRKIMRGKQKRGKSQSWKISIVHT